MLQIYAKKCAHKPLNGHIEPKKRWRAWATVGAKGKLPYKIGGDSRLPLGKAILLFAQGNAPHKEGHTALCPGQCSA